MPLTIGTRLGSYLIEALLGAGGMGEVYRARDTRLDRTVAIKVVGGRLQAFDGTLEREARAVAALNHPHICALHDVGRENETPFLVMEYVDGETLAQRLTGGPLAVREVIRYAIQIAEALDHAHRHGVIHRDLKPSNIMLTKSGVKVLDFGLATIRAAAPLETSYQFKEGASTAKLHLASERTLLGTVYYMAPERLEGRDANAASDLFAFGAVMYEMATGRRAFESDTPAGVIGAILRSEPPPPTTVRPELPVSIDWFIQKSLAKNPDDRWHAAGDMVEVLRWIARGGEHAPQRAPSPRLLPVALALLVGAGAMFAVMRAVRSQPDGAPPLTLSILPPAGGGFTPTPASVPTPQFALSPDARRLVFVAALAHGAPQLWVRALDSLQPEPLHGTVGAEYPFWSPDGESIGFFANGSLKRLDLAGGPARVLAPAPNGRGGTWSRDGAVVFAPTTEGGLYRVPAGGGEAAPLTRVDAGRYEASHRWPQFLPDDRHFLYFVHSTSPEAHGIYVGNLESATPARRLVTSGLSAAYAAPDHLLFVVDDALMATRFEWKSQRVVGDPVQVVPRVAGSSNFYAAFSVSHTGLLAYASRAASAELVWFAGRDGRRIGSVGPPAEYADFRLSPYDDQLAVAEVDAQTHRPDLRVLDLARGAKLRITYDAATDASPVWSPDGQQIVFRSNRSGTHDLFQRAANGAGQHTLLFQSPNAKYPTDWMPDGRGIVYHTSAPGTGSDIWLVTADGSKTTPLVQTAFDEMQGQVSPDGRWLAYTSLETGEAAVYIRSLSNPAIRWQVSAAGGRDPRWRGDSRELFYISGDSWLTAVEFADRQPAAPRQLFQVRVSPPGNPYLSNYDVTADGRRFLLKMPVHDVTSSPIHVLTNWLDAAGQR
jgi:Tol biopolymer transport system component/predicted Ser/Thr protein kinase